MNQNQVFPVVNFFKTSLDMNRSDIKRVVKRIPQVLTLHVERKMLPQLKFLVKEMGIDELTLKKLVKRFPQIFSHGTERLRERTGLFRTMGMTDQQVTETVKRAPEVLGLVLDKRLDFWREIVEVMIEKQRKSNAAHLDSTLSVDDIICSMTLLCPAVLLLKHETVEAKLWFALDVMKLEPIELIKFPHYFTYSFRNRIEKRHGILKAMNIHNMSIASMLVRTDDKFEKACISLSNKESGNRRIDDKQVTLNQIP